MNTSAPMRGSALIVAADREDRRVLFDVLDVEAFEAIYSARDYQQARDFLRQDPGIELVLLEFRASAREATAFCAELRARPVPPTPAIGVLRDADESARRRSREHAPGIVAWLDGPVKFDEALECVRGVVSARAPEESPRAAGAVSDFYQFAFDGSLDELAIVDPADGRILDVNGAFVHRSGHPRKTLLGARIDDFDAAADAEQRAEVARSLAREGSAQLRGRKFRADGSSYAVDMHVRLAVQGAKLVHFYLFRDLAELDRCEQALHALGHLRRTPRDGGAEAALRAVVDWLAPEFAVVAATTAELSGAVEALATHQRFAAAPDAPDPLAGATFRGVLGGAEIVHADGAWRHRADDPFVRDGHYECVIGLPLLGDRDSVLGVLLLARREALADPQAAVEGLRLVAHVLSLDLELRRVRDRGESVGLLDALTGLPNRLLFNDRLATTINDARRTGETFALLFVDVDRFKSVNDSLGHAFGDKLLAAVAKRLQLGVRGSDTVARYAGDEFTLILRHITQRADVMRIAEKIVRSMEAPLALAGGPEVVVTASIGISFYPDDATDAEHLLKCADVAMYSAKGLGRNNFQAYVAAPEESHRQRLALEAKLRQAEKNGELRLYYQPQIDGADEDIVGMEALIRWEHPELGTISPDFFIPLAEDSGLIVPIGEWVLRTACFEARRWQQRFRLPLRIGVNLSPLQLRQPGLVALVERVLVESGLPPQLLDLEVTESISMKSIPNLIETLHGLRGLGCTISIDDFGTGQSSLDYIKRFPADRIKIDQAFVRNIGVDPDDEAIVQATVSMAHNLNREVVAEGVETEQHLEFLREQGCEVVQGFLFCRPLPPAAFEILLLERERLIEERRAFVPQA